MGWGNSMFITDDAEILEREQQLQECPCHQCQDYRDDKRASVLPPRQEVPVWYQKYARGLLLADIVLRMSAVLSAAVSLGCTTFSFDVAFYGLLVSIVLAVADLFLLGLMYGIQTLLEIANYLHYWYVEAWPRPWIDPFTDMLFHGTVAMGVFFAGGTVTAAGIACFASDKNFVKFVGESQLFLQVAAAVVVVLVLLWAFVGLCNILAHCHYRRRRIAAKLDKEGQDDVEVVSKICV